MNNPFPKMDKKSAEKRLAKAMQEQGKREGKRIKELPQKMDKLRNEVWAQVRLLKEMGHHQNFCDRVMLLFKMQVELRDKVCHSCGHGADSHVATFCSG